MFGYVFSVFLVHACSSSSNRLLTSITNFGPPYPSYLVVPLLDGVLRVA